MPGHGVGVVTTGTAVVEGSGVGDLTVGGREVDADGELKTMMLPEELMNNPPSSIKKILKIFGIKDIHQFEPRTLH